MNRVKLIQSVRDDGKNRCVLRRLNLLHSLRIFKNMLAIYLSISEK